MQRIYENIHPNLTLELFFVLFLRSELECEKGLLSCLTHIHIIHKEILSSHSKKFLGTAEGEGLVAL